MKKILSLILVAAMVMSLAVMTASAEDSAVGNLSPMAPSYDGDDMTLALDENQVDEQGIYYSLDRESMTAIVGKNTYSDSASADAGLTTDSIVIPETVSFGGEDYTVTAIGRNAFDGTEIRKVATASTVATIGEFAFAGCTELEYAYTAATEIKGFAFWGCTSLITVQISTVDSIGGGAFWNCSNLQNPVIGASVIMEKAFAGCTKAEYFVMIGDAPAVGADAFDADAKAVINTDAAGYEDFPIETTVSDTFFDIEDVYAKPGETVRVCINYSFITDMTYDVVLTLADGLTTEYTEFTIGSYFDSFGGILTIRSITVAEDAAPGVYAITGTINGVEIVAGSITICDHAETKTVTNKAASCTEPGSESVVCTACGEVLSTADVEAKDHSYTDFVIAPTCTEGGYTRHICNCCSHAYTDAEVDALGHSWDEGTIKVEPSSSKNGLIVYTCTTCGTKWEPIIKYGDANGDAKVNISDATLMLKKIAKWDLGEKALVPINADADGNGKINISDVTLLLKFIAKWDVVLGPKN